MIQSIGILSRSGKILVSRQNVSIARTRIEGLYATFIRMCNTISNSSFETDGVRFLFRLCEDVYIVLITTLSSNVIEDTEIMNAIIASFQQKLTITSKGITQGMFEVLFILDEFLQWGFVEKISVSNVRANLAMRSKDEEMYLQQLEIKKAEAARIAKQKAEEIREEKELKEKLAMLQGLQTDNFFEPSPNKTPLSTDYIPVKETPSPILEKKTVKKTVKTGHAKGGLQLGKKKPAETIIEEIKKDQEENTSSNAGVSDQIKEEKKLMVSNAIVKVNEESHITVSAETSAINVVLNGSLGIAVAEGVEAEMKLAPIGVVAKAQMHPHVDPKAFVERILKLKEGKKLAVNTPAIYIKWNYKAEEFSLPITFTCWPAEAQNGLTLSMSYEATQELKDVVVEIPNLGPITVISIDGNLEVTDKIQWIIGDISDGSNGSLEIEISGEGLETSRLFPISVEYLHEHTLTGNEVVEVISNGQSIEFEKEVMLNATYQIIP
ncbi:coatomer subunit delta, putative [Entamoeba dispar SAW760]|uniref:Coatomer subunit delta n=1 Tax=Entamoeba dispar (strain ATCC PRA-260 / SAW760) TaxID=370354 RepID=B0ECU4_ENTDS|nr:coatomer subunit delta, putative [Entamoeba dispar SAW760]EDR27636.1 coatomer subunit delta, putative [Entamoeba dispar SAW760]|eukprot:EDR27636.1 coatomer subunit delta, putative [Entamoeba dispar SAW760]